MTVRFQRLLLILFSLILLLTSILLILFNSNKNLVFFYTPSELLASNAAINDTVRIGGYVQKNSITRHENNKYKFIITDNNKILQISYTGLVPDLFREEQGVVIEGTLLKNYVIEASKVFAKHDENYMPASIKKQLENKEYWKKKYK